MKTHNMSQKFHVLLVMAVVVLSLSGCQSYAVDDTHIPHKANDTERFASGKSRPCTEPRSKICTREFRPVCASMQIDNECKHEACSAQRKTYPNACSACADRRVISYDMGYCAHDKK